MIKVTANINGEKREVTNYSYQCNLRFCDFPNFAQLIMIYKSVKCKEPPVEGDLIALTFDSTGKDSFFYEWIISGDMYDGEIEFVCNEVDVVDIFRFWDCYCIGIEESMSIGGAPMSCTVYLSPGIIKRNNLPIREKVWKVSNPSTDKKVADKEDTQESKKETSNVTFSIQKDTTANNLQSNSTERKISNEKSALEPKTILIFVKPPFKMTKTLQKDANLKQKYKAELVRQLTLQQEGINNMTVAKWLANRQEFKDHGRSKDGNKEQQTKRAFEKVKMEDNLLSKIEDGIVIHEGQKIAEEEIENYVEKYFENLNALHSPDQIAGGESKLVTGMGNKTVNKSIGKMWGKKDSGRAQNIENEIEQWKAGPPPKTQEELEQTYMNVDLISELFEE